jgi:hypothetical protein
LAALIGPELRKPLREGDKQQWYFTCTLRIPDVGHKVRVVVLWSSRDAAQARIILVSNRVQWEVTRGPLGARGGRRSTCSART